MVQEVAVSRQRLAAAILALGLGRLLHGQGAALDFQRKIRPVWSDNCFQGHGPDSSTRLARLEAQALSPAPAADRRTLIRRVALDTTGLPPKPAEIEAFLKDTVPDAYERMVDRYLASPHYGEHRARYWLDAARYGDTHGI